MDLFLARLAEARSTMSYLPTYEDPLGSCIIPGLTEEDKNHAIENARRIETADMLLKLRLFLLDD